jgi:hypothetical protein
MDKSIRPNHDRLRPARSRRALVGRGALTGLLVGLTMVATHCATDRTGHVDEPALGLGSMMHQKLEHAQQLVEAIVLKDFDAIEKHALALNAISQNPHWKIHRSVAFVDYSKQFQQLTTQLADEARQGELHSATGTYTEMLNTCVQCHHYMRQEGLVPIEGGAMLPSPKPLEWPAASDDGQPLATAQLK